MMRKIFVFAFIMFSFQLLYGKEKTAEIKLNSTAFADGGMIPKKHTCDGSDISPKFTWTGIPRGTKSIAIICDDPDAPVGDWVHWVIFNIPSITSYLPENLPAKKELPDGTRQGINDFGKIGYLGPCPPGQHRYNFKIYALDVVLKESPGITKKQLLQAMEGHITGYGKLTGYYQRE